MLIGSGRRRTPRAKLTLEEKIGRINGKARRNFYSGMDRDISRAGIRGRSVGRKDMLPWVREVYDRKEALLNKYLTGEIWFVEIAKHPGLFSKKELAKLKLIPEEKAKIEQAERIKASRRPH